MSISPAYNKVDLTGKSIIVTGGGSGMGRSASLLIASRGGLVTVVDLNETGGQDTVATIIQAGGQAQFVRADITNEDESKGMVDAAVATYGGLAGAFNNAGIMGAVGKIHEYSYADWQKVLTINLNGVFLSLKNEIAHMVDNGGGSIVNTASTAALTALPRFAAYTAAKGGIVALTRSVALDYGSQGIRCNAVCPGLVETPATVSLLADPERRRLYEQKQLLGRFGDPTDIASAVVYLASDDASYVTGQTLVVDGGRLIA